ncbi:MAG: hypothetical protein CSA97_03815 [Bacteroidetes bacterium]|nr:MAG: hypothetical protein CSA97_03815 [Bacteroidota bacterium]
MDKHTDPLSREELAQLTTAYLQKPQGDDKRHWRSALRRLVAELKEQLQSTEQGRRSRAYRNSGEDLERTGCILKALLDCAATDLELKVFYYPASKGEERQIKRMDYRLAGQLVLRLSHYGPHFRPFFGGSYTQDDLIFSLDLLQLLLPRYARFCLEGALALGEKKHEKVKEEKIRNVATGSVGVMAQSLLAAKGYAHHLSSEQKSEVLQVRLSERQRAEFRLPYSSFVQKAGHLLPTLDMLENLLRESPFPVGVGYIRQISWGNTQHRELSYHEGDNNPTIQGHQLETFKRLEELFQPNPMSYLRYLPRYTKEQLDQLAGQTLPGLEQSVESRSYRGVPTIAYSQQGECFLRVTEDSIRLRSWYGWRIIMSYDPRSYRFMHSKQQVLPLPPFEWLQEMIPRLANFALERARLPISPLQQDIQHRRHVQQELKRIIPPMMEAAGEKYALELPDSWADYPARLHVYVNTRRAITLHISYTQADGIAERVEQALQLARSTMAKAPMAFQLHYSESDKTIWTEP